MCVCVCVYIYIYINQNSSLHYEQGGHKPDDLGGLVPFLPTVLLTSQNSALPPFGIADIKYLFATDKNSRNLDSVCRVSISMLAGAQSHLSPVKYVSTVHHCV